MSRIEKHISAQYIGRENSVTVHVGDEVRAGSVIASSYTGKTKVYSTADGIVKRITNTSVLLEYEVEIIEEPIIEKPQDNKQVQIFEETTDKTQSLTWRTF